MPLTFGSLFAGIGGFDLGFERAGMQCRWQVEIDKDCQKILSGYWPDAGQWDDIRTFPPPPVTDWFVDIICGGFPCQDISFAGKGRGIKGKRSGLWKEYVRTIRILQPKIVVVENVAALLNRGIGIVLGDLAACGYDAEWDCLPAKIFGAPMERDRIFLVAKSRKITFKHRFAFNRFDGIPRNKKWDTTKDIKSGGRWKHWLSSAAVTLGGVISPRDFCGMDDGLSSELDAIGALGNSVCPQIAEWIGKKIIRICPE